MSSMLAQLTIASIFVHSVVAVGTHFPNALDKKSINKVPHFQAAWAGEGRWIGRAWWANPLWDWQRIGNGQVRAPAAERRSLSLLPFEIGWNGASFAIQTTVTFSKIYGVRPAVASTLAAGFAIGRSGPLDDYRSAAVYSSSQLEAVLLANGSLSIAGTTSKEALQLTQVPVTLILTCSRRNTSAVLSLTARRFNSKISMSLIVPLNKVTGPFALITVGPRKSAENPSIADITFKNFSVSGTMVKRYRGRMLGAIMWSQYLISEKTIRIQAQLAPLDKPVRVQLTVFSLKTKTKILTQSVWSESLSRTALFTVTNWNSNLAWSYELQVQVLGRLHKLSGTIRREPAVSTPFKIAMFSCDEGYLFPQTGMVSQVSQQKPDLLYFAGDQIYNPTGGFRVEQKARTEVAMLDFLLRWYLFGWTWGKLLRNIPSVIIPDDHDVFQGNLWGVGGRAFPFATGIRWDSGGYLMPGPWISAVERCHTGHLPPSRANLTTPLGLKSYFTSISYSGLSMAVLEDRKFKSAPASFEEPALTLGLGGSLLGDEQEDFLKTWVEEWNGAFMKVAFSQTIFCNAATHFGKELYRLNLLYDSGGWPFDARNRAVELMGQGNVLALHGDQHLGMLLRHGVDKHDDAGVAFMVPGTANGYPRAWWPGVNNNTNNARNKNFTGRYFDDTRHPITVYAVGNPEIDARLLDFQDTPRIQLGRARGSGYGMVVMNRLAKTATFHLYRVGGRLDQFPGFPKKLFIGGRPN